MRKIWVSMSLVLLMLLTLVPQSLASEFSITVYIDGEELVTSVEPQVIDSRTFVPIRVIAEKWGAVVGWNQKLELVRITKDQQRIDLYINQKEAHINGEVVVSDAAPVVINGTTLIPLRFVGELLGADVDYDAKSRSVMVSLPEPEPDPDVTDKPDEKPIEGTVPDPDDEGAEDDGEQGETGENEENQIPAGPPAIEDVRVEGNKLILQADTPLKPSVFYLNHPDRIVIDITGVSLELDHLDTDYDETTHQSRMDITGSEMIQSVRFATHNPETSQVRFVLDLSTRGGYELTIDEETNAIVLDVKQGSYTIVIDAGHGDHDPGAIGYSGKKEKDFNLSLALKVQALLEQEPQFNVLMTRTSDVFLELEERTEFANGNGADAFISIHANAYQRSTRGTETFYTYDYQYEFAKVIHRHLLEATGFPDRKLKQNRFYVTRNTTMPAALIEVGFLTNPEEESILFQEQFQNKVAQALVSGIKEYFN